MQNENLLDYLAPDERGDGFVSTPFTLELLQELQNPDTFFVARAADGALAGYVFVGSWAFCARWPAFQVALERFPLRWNDQPLKAEDTFQYGPVCVARAFRGQGVLPLLFERVKSEMRSRFEVGTTWINMANGRSLRAHVEKLGLVPLDEFAFDGKEFVLLGFETKPNTDRSIQRSVLKVFDSS